jgi:hypothetical protein
VKTRKAYLALRNAPENAKNFYDARGGDVAAKAAQVQFNYNDLLPNGVLKGCRHPSSTFAHDIDCGDAQEQTRIKELLLAKKEEIGLLELSGSARYGLHAVCRRKPGTTIREGQYAVSMITQTEYDTNARGLARVMYTGPATADNLFYLDDAIFEEPLSVEQSAEEYKRLKERERSGREEIPESAKKANKHYRPWESPSWTSQAAARPLAACYQRDARKPSATSSGTVGGGSGTVGAGDLTFKGRPYAEIISEWWKLNGGEPQEGERNVKLYQLAVSLRAICDNNKELLLKVMPRYGLDDQEVQSIVESACKELPKGLSKTMKQILGDQESTNDEDAIAVINEQEMTRWLWIWGEQIEGLFEDFPILKDICKGLKKNQYPAALFVAGGFMMTLMTRCTYRFYHRPEELRRLNNSTLIIGDPACGKSFATRLYKLLAAPIMAADQVGKDAINAYREEMRTKGANKEKPKKPKVVIRVHPARTSNAQFIQDMVNAVEIVDGEPMHLHMLTFDTELDNTVTVQKGGSWIDKQSLELKAFHNEEDGQAYSNNDSIFQEFNVYWNFIYTGTPIALKKKVNEHNFGSGLATRLTCVPLPSTDYEMLERERHVDFESDGRIKTWATKLDRMKGLLPMDKIVDKLYDWTARRMMDAKENDSKADEMLLKRCAYHGLNFAAPFIVMRHWGQVRQDGDYWCGEFETDDTDWQLAELIVNIQYACQRHFFGAMAETYFDNRHRDAVMNRQHHQKTMECYNRLPSVFTMEDVRRCFGYDNDNSVYSKISRLKEDKLAEKIKKGNDKGKFRKMNLMVN